MDIRKCYWVALLAAFYLQPTHADATMEPAVAPESEVPAGTVQPAPSTTVSAPATEVTAQVWNKSKVPIVVSQKGRAQEPVEPAQNYKSLSYPQAPINIMIPENSPIKYITVTGKQGACTVPVCIYVQ